MSEWVKYSTSGGVATVTLNRPDKYNTLRSEVITSLQGVLEKANRDDDVRVIILQGAGDAFCAGFDFSDGLDAYDNMGLQSTQTLGPILDGVMRNTPQGRHFVDVASQKGVGGAVEMRDGPFGDYSQGAAEDQPRKRSELNLP
ncbi:MAG: hypothetical protein HOC23_21555 [Halieaceae bacterium]|jgi:enoyl-CoA hydratase/carnithine racemase|nr:hypothetical protein [Halieaceae bacterium]